MLLPIRAILASKPRRGGNYEIYFQYCYSENKRVLINTEIATSKTYWSSKRQSISKLLLPKENGDFTVLNRDLLRLRKIIEEIVNHGISCGEPNLGEYFRSNFKIDFDAANFSIRQTKHANVELGFVDEIDDYIKCKKATVAEGTFRTLRVMKERIIAFEKYRGAKIAFGR